MNKMSVAAIAVLLLSVMAIGAQTRKTLGTVDVATIEAMEHQRILAELEEVHQLRERMLQEGTCILALAPQRQTSCHIALTLLTDLARSDVQSSARVCRGVTQSRKFAVFKQHTAVYPDILQAFDAAG